MKYFTIFYSSFVIFYSLQMNAQIPNSGFEDWGSNGNPIDWWTNNTPGLFTPIIKTSDAHSGNWAVQGDVVTVSGLGVGPAIISGVEGVGIPINFRPVALKGYYKFTSVNNDYMQVQANLLKSGVGGIGGGAANLTPTGSYTEFNINIGYITGDVPDTVIIAVFIAGNGGFPNVGSKMFVDDLSWSNTSDVKELENGIPTEFALMQNYPNPFNPTTKIRYSIPEASIVTIKVYDMLGSEVATLINEEQPVGNYEVTFDASGLSSGMYLYKIFAGSRQSFIETRKMILIK
jgi:hypothetical protein